MGTTKLEALFLTEGNLQKAKQQIEKLAIGMWQSAGCPEPGERDFWQEAQAEWIRRDYVPDVTLV